MSATAPSTRAARRVQAVRRSAERLGAALNEDPPRSLAALQRWQREHWLLAGLFATATIFVGAIAPGFASSLQPAVADRIEVALALPPPSPSDPEPADTTVSATPPSAAQWDAVTVQSGQTLGDIFASLGIPASSLHRLLDHPGAREPLVRIRPGQRFEFDLAGPGELRALRFERDEATRVTLTLHPDRVDEATTSRDLQRRIQLAGGEIERSLFEAGSDAGLSNAAIIELAKVFGYDIDFAQDLRVGDRFSVVYEEVYRDGERLRSGDILAASFVNQGKRYDAYRYTFADGRVEYFDSEGRPMKKSFLRMPIEFARISSRFSSARRHPILGRVRAHKGVDYAAPTGTPIMSAGEGRITYAGWQNGYGRTIIVDHGRGTTTLYGHMSRLGKYRTGARVRQGDVIGYVGATGLASGPHLHYEFRVGGVHRDPLKVTLPKPEPLPRAELARFQLQTQPLLARLQLIEGGRAFAAR